MPITGMAKSLKEAPRGGAGIEIADRLAEVRDVPKPLVEGLVLKLRRCRPDGLSLWKPLVEGLVLKFG